MPPDPHFLLLASATPSGVAGHHYSVRDIGNALAAVGLDIELCLICAEPEQRSRALASTPHRRVEAGFCYLDAVAFVRRRLAEDPALVVFGYDELSVRIAIAATVGQRHRVVSVKPGWINSPSWSNGVANFILFTQENVDYYASHPRYAGVKLHYLPNRVAKPVPAPDARARLHRLLPGLEAAGPLLFCPIRIGWGKALTIDQALGLHSHLSEKDPALGLVIAGSVYDEDYVGALRAKVAAMPRVWLTTDPAVSGNISSYMDAFDIIIGAGRTSGEALCLGKRVFCPDPRGGLPVEITPQSYDGLAYSNFTGRVAAVDGDREAPGRELSALVAERLGAEAGVPAYRRIALDTLRGRVGTVRALRTWLTTVIRLAAIYGKSRWRGFRARLVSRSARAEVR